MTRGPGFNKIRQKRLSAVHGLKRLTGMKTEEGFRNTLKGNRKEAALGPAEVPVRSVIRSSDSTLRTKGGHGRFDVT